MTFSDRDLDTYWEYIILLLFYYILFFQNIHANSASLKAEHNFQPVFTCGVCLPSDTSGKEPAYQYKSHETQVPFLRWEDPLEESTVTHSNILA